MNHDFFYAAINPVIGGLFIGLASIGLLLFVGRIAGISGIFWQAVNNVPLAFDQSYSWRWLFLTGLILGPVFVYQTTNIAVPQPSNAAPLIAAIAGLLVGVGSKLGSGCTSGHGICGISRFSLRSIIATITFIMAGVVSVFLSRHIF